MGTVKYTGPVASFHCPTNAEIRSLKVHFSPKQLGEGDPNPENVREIEGWDGVNVMQSGKNLLDTSKIYQASTTQVMLGQNSGRSHWETFLKAGTYIITTSTSISASVYIAKKNSKNASNKIGETNKSNTFTIDSDYWCEFFIYKSSTGITVNDIISFQLEYNSTATSYESYHGSITNYEFGVLGKNKFNYTNANIIDKKRRDDNGNIVSDASGSYCQSFITVKPNTTYTVSGYAVNNDSKRIYYIDAEENFIARTAAFGTSSYTFTTPNNCYYIQIQNREVGDEASWETIQLELGSTATTYEPYDPNHTVYGGYVDLITGEVCEEWVKFSAMWNTFTKYPEYSPEDYSTRNYALDMTVYGRDYPQYNICNIAPTVSTNDYNAYSHCFMSRNGTQLICVLPDNLNENTIIECALKLQTSITYHIAPIQLQTFLGQNNIWSNADYVEVEYDLHETQNILLARKQFIIANQPHIKSASGAIASFTTDLAAPLKECKIHFSPIQEGSGDPSPSNVRPISGWDNIYCFANNKITFIEPTNSWQIPFLDTNIYYLGNGIYQVEGTTVSTGSSVVIPFSPVTHAANETYSFFIKLWPEGSIDGVLNFSLKDADNYNCPLIKYTQISDHYGMQTCTYTSSVTVENFAIGVAANVSDVKFQAMIVEDNTIIQPIDWSSTAGTIYGGYVDLVTGEVWETWEYGDMGDLNWGGASSTASTYSRLTMYPDAYGGTDYPLLLVDSAQVLTIQQFNNTIGVSGYYATINSSGRFYFMSPDIEGMTSQQIINWMRGKKYCVFSTPTLITTLTPTQLKTLRGTNNIWFNANGDIQIKYWSH